MTSKTKIAHAKQKNQFRFWAIKLLTMAFVAFPILFLFFSFPLSLYISLCSFSSFWSSILLSLNFYRFIIIANTHGEHTHAPFILTQKHVESTKIRILYLLDFRLKQYAIVLYVCLSYPFWFWKQKITRTKWKTFFPFFRCWHRRSLFRCELKSTCYVNRIFWFDFSVCFYCFIYIVLTSHIQLCRSTCQIHFEIRQKLKSPKSKNKQKHTNTLWKWKTKCKRNNEKAKVNLKIHKQTVQVRQQYFQFPLSPFMFAERKKYFLNIKTATLMASTTPSSN